MKIIERYQFGFKLYQGKGIYLLARPFCLLFSLLYGLISAVTAFRRRRLPVHRTGSAGEKHPRIISLGNLEAGGSGKSH